ncbi:MAG: PEP-CTERM sorting domain-containing protein [Terracidiphilus sp.]
MRGKVLSALALGLAGVLVVPAAFASSIPVGYVSYDVTGTGVAQFDINNETGVNSSGDPTFPVTTSVSLSSLSLDVKFASGPDEIFGPSYFTLSGDGISWTGNALSTGIGQPSGLNGAISATLTGDFSTTSFTLFDSSTDTVNSAFSATISDPSGLSDGDLAVIYATTGTVGATPEPESLYLLGTGMLALAGLRRRSIAVVRSVLSSKLFGMGSILGLIALIASVPVSANASVKLNTWTNPSSGASGSTIVTLTGSGFPAGKITPSNVNLSFSATCDGSVAATTTANTVVTVIGSSDRVTFLVPAALATGTYYIWITGTYASSNCSEITVTHTSTTLAACLPSSSLAVLTGTNVTAYVPNGAWDYGTTGISVVPIEGGGSGVALTTPNRVNSCSSNAATGETLCVDNLTNVYELSGSAITKTLTSSSNREAGFSGGACYNCGIAIDALTNTAVISGGFSGNSSGDGLQLLNLATNTFATPYPSEYTVSENISIDPNRNLILSPDEDDNYDLFKINSDGSLSEYGNNQYPIAGEFDSAAEDCTTGIALATQEFSNNLFIVDLTQATFTAPSGGNTAGTWTAPSQTVNLYPSDDFNFAAGTCGISVAAGTTHLGITEGEFGGNEVAVFQLPATSGSGTPGFVDYAGAYLPNTPLGTFSAGYDPHTITAYTSPNNGKAYGVVVDWASGYPDYVGVIDLQALMSATRSTTDPHLVDSSVNLLTSGIVTYIAIP